MGRSRTRRAAFTFGVLQAVAIAVALWAGKHFQVARLSVTGIALVPTLPGAYLAWLAYRDDRHEGVNLDTKAAVLAAAVKVEETRQRAQLTGDGAHRIDLTFRYRAEPANNATGAATTGRLSAVTTYYRGVHPARLVVTGAPGAGKTVLALDLVLGLLTDPTRTDADPVPVRISLAGWNTETPLSAWLANRIHQRFRDRGITTADAEALVEQHRILPVLDGLDEMDNDTTAVPRRRAVAALRQLNAYQDPAGNAPIILTCRTRQYHQLAALDVRMREAARIEIEPVTPAQADAYLTARSTDPTRWAQVVTTLHTAPSGTLARSLDTPWRLNLAATVYEERDPDTQLPIRQPDELSTLASPDAVRDHLLRLYLPAAVHQHPTRPGRHTPEQTHRRLAALATHLATTTSIPGSGTDLVLHELWPMAGPLRVRTADTLATLLLGGVLTALFLAQVPIGFSPSQLSGAAGGVLGGLWAAVMAGSPTVPEPRMFHLDKLRSPGPQRTRLATDLAVGPAVGFAIALVFGPVFGPAFGLTIGLTTGLTVGLTTGLAGSLTTPLRNAPPGDPRHPVRDDLAFTFAFTFAFALTFALAGGLTVGLTGGLTFGLTTGLTIGLIFGAYMFAGAGRRYLVFLCCIRGRLPWRLGAFLHWCYGAGLLRISGVAYQFRHHELQDWLATHPNP